MTSRHSRGRTAIGPLALVPTALLLSACGYLSQTPSADTRIAVRATVSYGMAFAEAESRLSGLDYGCSIRHGDYFDESGHARNADRYVFCERRPAQISFACENRDQVVLTGADDAVAGIEVTRGPSCVRQ